MAFRRVLFRSKLMNDFRIDVFAAYGVPRDEAAICADVLLEADRRGIESHGCNRFKPIYIDRFENGTLLPKTEIEVLKETPTTLVTDAHDGMGMVASYRMMEALIEKAKKYGMAGGAIRNSTHYGIAGYWATMARMKYPTSICRKSWKKICWSRHWPI